MQLQSTLIAVVVALVAVSVSVVFFRPGSEASLAGFVASPPLQELAIADVEAFPQVQKLFRKKIHGPGGVLEAEDGSLYVFDSRGALWMIPWQPADAVAADGEVGEAAKSSPRSGNWQTPKLLAFGGPGRVLGAAFDAQGNIVLCNTVLGLLRLEPTGGRVTVLATTAAGGDRVGERPFSYAYDVAVAADGRVFFTTTASRPPAYQGKGIYGSRQELMLQVLQGEASGMLLEYNPETGRTQVLMSDLQLPTGVALSPSGSFVAFAEAGAQRLRRYWLAGAKAGTSDVLLDALPGIPFGLRADGQGGFWAVMPVRRPAASLRHALGVRVYRQLARHAPAIADLLLRPWPCLLQVDEHGGVVRMMANGSASGPQLPAMSVTPLHSAPSSFILSSLSASFLPMVVLKP